MRILELFAGYGSQALALENLGIEFTSDISEIDKYAIQAYEQLHGATHNWGDICKIDETQLPYYDLITYSSPCQDFSVAGLGKGGDADSGTRSSLLWQCDRIIRAVRPKYLLMENVKNLVGEKHKHNFIKWLKVLESLGYQNFWKVLNAKDYGVPQNRERVFVVSILSGGQYLFPNPIKLEKRLKDVLENDVDEKYYISSDKIGDFAIDTNKVSNAIRCGGSGSTDKKHTWDIIKEPTQKSYAESYDGVIQVGNVIQTDSFGGNPERGRVYDDNGVSPTLNTMQGGGREPKILKNYRIRKLTPRECWRLMGVKDEQFNRLHDISNSQLYKMAGNSIVVDVLMGIFRNLFLSDEGTSGQLILL
jgi:DNA (cytosine-5)-methyltransferase 1